jgi:glutathionyl-hydroquinone reductase
MTTSQADAGPTTAPAPAATQQAQQPASNNTVVFRNSVKADGSTPFTPEAGRYRLYISLACPWASRCYLTVLLKGLEDAIPVTVVHPHLGDKCVQLHSHAVHFPRFVESADAAWTGRR